MGKLTMDIQGRLTVKQDLKDGRIRLSSVKCVHGLFLFFEQKRAGLGVKRFFWCLFVVLCFVFILCSELTSLYLTNSGIGQVPFIPKYALRMFVIV